MALRQLQRLIGAGNKCLRDISALPGQDAGFSRKHVQRRTAANFRRLARAGQSAQHFRTGGDGQLLRNELLNGIIMIGFCVIAHRLACKAGAD